VARNRFSHTASAEIALVAATEKTLLQLNAAAGVCLAISGVVVSFDSTSNTAEPVIVKLIRVTTAGTGTARNPNKLNSDMSTGLQVSGTENHTVEGTNGDILAIHHIHPQAGMPIPIPLPEGEVVVPGGGRIAVKCTAPANVNALATVFGEE
jgi:hypothetical protein